MSQQTEPLSLHDGVVVGTFEAPQLAGSRCRRCGVVAFPRQASCAACTSGATSASEECGSGPSSSSK